MHDVKGTPNRADKTTTLNIYTHAIRSADEAAAEKLNQILNPTQLYKAN